MRYHLAVALSVDSTVSGNIADHSARLRHAQYSLSSDRVQIPMQDLAAGGKEYWDMLYEDEGGHIEINDVFCPYYRYPRNATISPDSVRIDSYRLSVSLDQDILVEYAA